MLVKWLKRNLSRVPTIVWVVSFFQLLHVIDECKKDWTGLKPEILIFWSTRVSEAIVDNAVFYTQVFLGGLSIVSMILFFRFLYLVFFSFPKLLGVLYTLTFIFYFLLLSYLYSLEVPFDFSILALNFNTIGDADFLLAALPYVRTGPLFLLIICLIALYRLGVKKKAFVEVPPRNPKTWAMAAFCIYILFVWAPFTSYDPLLNFFKSGYVYYKQKLQTASYTSEDYALIQPSFPLTELSFRSDSSKQPNVLIVMVESLNAFFAESKDDDGRAFMPYFNSLIKDGLYVEHFYGNSVQSCKGQFATLTSLIPPIYGFGFRHYFGTRYRTLPEVLHEHGYYNVFFQGSGNLLADNTKSFLDHNHFDAVKSARHAAVDTDKPDIFGWGVQDKILYRTFFEFYDATIEPKQKPFFAVLPTIFTHNNTVQIPEKDRYFYKNASKSFEYFSNVVHLTDRHLKLLIQGLEDRGILENTIVIITGDHSRSAISDSKVSFNQTGFSDDIFQVPFLLLWKNKVSPFRVSHIAFSQVDIAPTVVDLLGLDIGSHHFQGKSMFQQTTTNDVFLVQPYNGIFLSVVNLPYKFGEHLRSGKKYLYNIISDPYEQKNIYDSHSQIALSMQKRLERVYQTNSLIETNKIWNK